MKRRSIIIVMILFVFLYSEFIQSVHGNPVVIRPGDPLKVPGFALSVFIIMFFIGSWLEYAYFNIMFYKKIKANYSSKYHYRLFLKINLVTFPLTQILAYFFYIYFSQYFWISILLIEIGVVFIEFFLLRIELHKAINVEMPSKLVFISSLFANVLSFFIGFPLLLNLGIGHYSPL